MSEAKKEEKPVSSNTINPEDFLTEEEKRKLQVVRDWDAEANASNLLIRYETFGASKAERDKLWEAWAKTFKEDASSILRGVCPPPRQADKKVDSLDLSKIEDENVRIEIIRLWMEQRSGKKFTTRAGVI